MKNTKIPKYIFEKKSSSGDFSFVYRKLLMHRSFDMMERD